MLWLWVLHVALITWRQRDHKIFINLRTLWLCFYVTVMVLCDIICLFYVMLWRLQKNVNVTSTFVSFFARVIKQAKNYSFSFAWDNPCDPITNFTIWDLVEFVTQKNLSRFLKEKELRNILKITKTKQKKRDKI